MPGDYWSLVSLAQNPFYFPFDMPPPLYCRFALPEIKGFGWRHFAKPAPILAPSSVNVSKEIMIEIEGGSGFFFSILLDAFLNTNTARLVHLRLANFWNPIIEVNSMGVKDNFMTIPGRYFPGKIDVI
jgi:hypothetical protein